jgi:hypothetical protein
MLNLIIEIFFSKSIKSRRRGQRTSNDTSSKMTKNQLVKIKLTIAYDAEGVIRNPTHFKAYPDLTQPTLT